MSDEDAALDRAFAALADPVRRAIVARLSRGSATLGELAEPFSISLQAVSKPVHLDAAALERLTAWIDRYRLDAERSFRRLDAVLAAATAAEPPQTPRKNTTRSKEKES